MPVFNWDVNGVPLIGPGFKYYWAVTIPLTVLVLKTWALGMFLPWRRWFAGTLHGSKASEAKCGPGPEQV
jgi:hypothetical protein